MKMIWFALFAFAKAFASRVSGDGDKMVQYGEEAHYSCNITPVDGVRQVTWQRSFEDQSIENLATFSHRFGEQVNEPYRGKVILTGAALNSTSIMLKNASWEDESCYICLFNTYPEGSKKTQTCLTVQGISKVTWSHDMDRHVFTCSATGKPAPTIRWSESQANTEGSSAETNTTRNGDGTFTTTSRITLTTPEHKGGNVDCVLNDGRASKRTQRIYAGNPDDRKGSHDSRSRVSLMLAAGLVFLCLSITAAVIYTRRLKTRRVKSGGQHRRVMAQA